MGYVQLPRGQMQSSRGQMRSSYWTTARIREMGARIRDVAARIPWRDAPMHEMTAGHPALTCGYHARRQKRSCDMTTSIPLAAPLIRRYGRGDSAEDCGHDGRWPGPSRGWGRPSREMTAAIPLAGASSREKAVPINAIRPFASLVAPRIMRYGRPIPLEAVPMTAGGRAHARDDPRHPARTRTGYASRQGPSCDRPRGFRRGRCPSSPTAVRVARMATPNIHPSNDVHYSRHRRLTTRRASGRRRGA